MACLKSMKIPYIMGATYVELFFLLVIPTVFTNTTAEQCITQVVAGCSLLLSKWMHLIGSTEVLGTILFTPLKLSYYPSKENPHTLTQ